jgi:hypothetical protein
MTHENWGFPTSTVLDSRVSKTGENDAKTSPVLTHDDTHIFWNPLLENHFSPDRPTVIMTGKYPTVNLFRAYAKELRKFLSAHFARLFALPCLISQTSHPAGFQATDPPIMAYPLTPYLLTLKSSAL